MKNTNKDLALKSAIDKNIEEQSSIQLSSNFSIKTMQRIANERKKAIRREKILSISFIVVAFLVSIFVINDLYGEILLREFNQFAWTIPPTIFCMVFLFTLNFILKKKIHS